MTISLLENAELKKVNGNLNEYILIVRLDEYNIEFADEFGPSTQLKRDLIGTAKKLVKERYPTIRVTMIKLMIGGTVISTIPLMGSNNTHAAQSNSSVNSVNIETSNSLSADIIAEALKINQATNRPQIILDGKRLNTDAIIINGSTYVPIRAVSESLGANVGWNPTSRTVEIDLEGNNISFVVNSTVANVNGQRVQTNPSLIIDGSTMVPLRFVGETLGMDVGWDSTTRTVSLKSLPTLVQSLSFYQVGVGDTLWNIAREYNTTVDDIKKVNNLTSDYLRANQQLIIPKAFHKVSSGESLWVISKRYGVSIDAIKNANKLTSTILSEGQTLVIPATIESKQNKVSPNVYKIVSGDTLWIIANRFGVSVDALKSANNLTNETLFVGQILNIPTSDNINQLPTTPPTNATPATPTAPTVPQAPTAITHTVILGDTLWAIAKQYGTTVDVIRTTNNLKTDNLLLGQSLVIPSTSPSEVTPQPVTGGVTKSYVNHTVRSGDNMWNLSMQYGVPYLELLRENNMTERSSIQIGQVLKVPQYNVPVKPVVSPRHGEVLDWWTEARYVFSTGKIATVTDFQTGKTFQVRHTMGGNHADSEPLTAQDAQIMKEIWGGSYSWTPRAVIVEVDGRRLAAAMESMPHGDYVLKDNNYNGHFGIHFLNSTRHKDGLIQESMQKQVEIAAGRALR
jgi:peptidoglycan endopeptidase LytF